MHSSALKPTDRWKEADDVPGFTVGNDQPSPAASTSQAVVDPSPEKDPLETLALAAVVSPKHNGDVRSLVTVMDLLKRKEHLLYSLHAMNEQAESSVRPPFAPSCAAAVDRFHR